MVESLLVAFIPVIVAKGIRLLPLEETAWHSQIISEIAATTRHLRELQEFIKVWQLKQLVPVR